MHAATFAAWLIVGLVACRDRASPGSADAPSPSSSSLAEQVPSVAPPSDLAAPPSDATRTPSGLAWRTVTRPPSTSVEPLSLEVNAIVKFTGWSSDGKTFALQSHPLALLYDVLMPGMREGIVGMRIGEVRRLWIPETLTDGRPRPHPPGPLVLDVELVAMRHGPNAPEMSASPVLPSASGQPPMAP